MPPPRSRQGFYFNANQTAKMNQLTERRRLGGWPNGAITIMLVVAVLLFFSAVHAVKLQSNPRPID